VKAGFFDLCLWSLSTAFSSAAPVGSSMRSMQKMATKFATTPTLGLHFSAQAFLASTAQSSASRAHINDQEAVIFGAP
jgi:hypothetical protein